MQRTMSEDSGRYGEEERHTDNLLAKNLATARTRQKYYGDKRRRDVSFNVGD